MHSLHVNISDQFTKIMVLGKLVPENLIKVQSKLHGTNLVFCVSQNTLHGALSCSLNHLLDVIIFGLQSNKKPLPL